MSTALWGLAAAGGTAMAGAVAADVWRSARVWFTGLLGPEGGPAGGADREAAHRPAARRTCVQHNTAREGGTQHITLSGDVHVGRDDRGRR
ncbi:hypothetical protein [Streptomyces sp. NPDC013455]|uniref:hypothetical protein n=1 Tax=Streptomyces sp. NPDC013455 TaxID=3155605 RepID=UPI0033CB88E1